MNVNNLRFNESGELLYDLRKSSITDLYDIIDTYSIKGVVIQIGLDICGFSEIKIQQNLETLEELRKNGIKLKFFYYYNNKAVSDEITLEQIKDNEKFLETIVTEIKGKFSSNLERIIAAYDIAKNIKKYRSNETNKGLARALYCYLDNDYMVCAGYANFLNNLLTRLGIPCVSLPINCLNHFRNYIYVVDSEYGLNGFYSADACWDELGTYNYFLETSIEGRAKLQDYLEYRGQDADILLTQYDSCFFANNVEELKNNSKYIARILWWLANDFYLNEVPNFRKDNDQAKKVLDFFKQRVNKKIPRQTLIDAILKVKSQIFKNFSEQYGGFAPVNTSIKSDLEYEFSER